MDNVDQFVELLFKEKGFPELDEDVVVQIKKDLTTRLISFMNRRLIEALPEDALVELDKLLEQEPVEQAKIQQFLADHLSNVVEISTNAFNEFRQIYLGTSS